MKEGFRSEMLIAKEKVQSRNGLLKQHAKWLCKCDCGGEKIVLETSLYSKCVKSCGCREYKNKKKYHLADDIEFMKREIERKVKINSDQCWEWQGAKHKQGYGNIIFKKKCWLSHRLAWTIYKGEIKDNLKVCHKCDKPLCCNPNHLFLGTQLENVQDGFAKGRMKKNIPATRRIKLNYSQVTEIKKLHDGGMTRKELEKKYDVSQTCIAKIINGVSWKQDWTKEV